MWYDFDTTLTKGVPKAFLRPNAHLYFVFRLARRMRVAAGKLSYASLFRRG
jgi:hypothetical protein